MANLIHTITVTSSEYRPCLVDGEDALFHRWATREHPVFMLKVDKTSKDVEKIFDQIHEKNIIPYYVDVVKTQVCMAIVEMCATGQVLEVEPTRISFLDTNLKIGEGEYFDE